MFAVLSLPLAAAYLLPAAPVCIGRYRRILGVMSAPRELVLGEEGRLRVTPARELHRLRDIAVVGRMSPGATRTTIELGEPTALSRLLSMSPTRG